LWSARLASRPSFDLAVEATAYVRVRDIFCFFADESVGDVW
jgi:hypothetical protein